MPYSSLQQCLHPGCSELVKRGYCNNHLHSSGYYPALHKQLSIQIIMVIGAPASGKSTFVENNRKRGDLVLDLDIIKSELSGKPLYSFHDKDVLEKALGMRNKVLESLQYAENTGQILWFIVGAPDRHDRQKWKDILHPSQTCVVLCTKEECLSRIKSRQSETEREQIIAVERWFATYEPMGNETIISSSGSGDLSTPPQIKFWIGDLERAGQDSREIFPMWKISVSFYYAS